MTQGNEKNPKYYREFFRDMPISGEKKCESQLSDFCWSRLFLGAVILLVATSLCFSLLTGIFIVFNSEGTIQSFIDVLILISNFIAALFGLFILSFLATFFFGGIQSLIWALILECLYTAQFKIKMAWAIIGAILAVLPLHIVVAGVCELFNVPTLIAYLSAVCGGIVATLMLHKDW